MKENEIIERKMKRFDELFKKHQNENLNPKELREFVNIKQQAERKWKPSSQEKQTELIEQIDSVREELDKLSCMPTTDRKKEAVQERKRNLKKKLEQLILERDSLNDIIIEEKALLEAEISALLGEEESMLDPEYNF